MNEKTINSDNWATNLMLTEKADNEFTKLLANSIFDSVFLFNKNVDMKSDKESTLFVEDESNSFKITLPNFNKKYSIQERKNYSSKTQKWFGIVTSIEGEIFSTDLDDLTNPGTKESCIFDIYDVSPDDRDFLKVGATFYWTIGYKDIYGQRIKESSIRFRRLGLLTDNDINIIEDRANEMFESLLWDE